MYRIGKLVSTHGLKGRLVLAHTLPDSNWLRKETVLYLEEMPGSYIPYFLRDFSPWDDSRYGLELEGVEDREQARRLQGMSVWIEENIVPATDPGPSAWKGFRLIDRQAGDLGEIHSVLEIGPQWIAQLFIEGKEVLVPLAEDLILEQNARNRYLRMDLPAGLLDLYLGSSEK